MKQREIRTNVPSNGAEFFQRDRTLHPPALTPGYKTSVTRSPKYALLSLQNSLSEITGPTFGHSDLGPLDNDPVSYTHLTLPTILLV